MFLRGRATRETTESCNCNALNNLKLEITAAMILNRMVVLFHVFLWFAKGWFSKRVVLADVPPERKAERGYIRMFPQNENRNAGAFECSPGTKTGKTKRLPQDQVKRFLEQRAVFPHQILKMPLKNHC